MLFSVVIIISDIMKLKAHEKNNVKVIVIELTLLGKCHHGKTFELRLSSPSE